MREHLRLLLVALILWPCASSCFFGGGKPKDAKPAADAQSTAKLKARGKSPAPAAQSIALTPVDLSDAVHPILKSGAVELAAAKNEWTGFVLQVGPRVAGASYSLRINEILPGSSVEVYQVLAMPVDVNRAGYARHTGQDATRGDLPRALLPLRAAADGSVELAGLRDASRLSDPTATMPANEPALLWVDVRIPADAPAGEFAATCEALADGKVAGLVPLKLTVYDFALPNDRHLEVVGLLDWGDLQRLYPTASKPSARG